MRNTFKLVLLSDNLKGVETLYCEHGLCAFLDTGTHQLLLDTGASNQFIHNAKTLGIDLTTIDYVFISHGHRDHMGGLTSFLELNVKAKVLLSSKIMNKSFFSTRHGGKKNIGIDFDFEKYQNRCVYIDQATKLHDEIDIFPCSCSEFAAPKANSTLFFDTGSGLQADDFSHELVLGIGSENPVIYTGCAHNGLLNILQSFRQTTGMLPNFVIGGFHLLDSESDHFFETEEELNSIAAFLRIYYPDTSFLTGHCTGTQAYEHLKNQLHRQLELFHTGYQAHI